MFLLTILLYVPKGEGGLDQESTPKVALLARGDIRTPEQTDQ